MTVIIRRAGGVVGVGVAVLAGVMVSHGCHQPHPPAGGVHRRAAPMQALWVTRWDYRTADDIALIMERCRSAGFNTVLFQVRGHGLAHYRSHLEPWAEEFEGRDPGFDPLAVACEEAHRRGLQLHAWVNVLPGWRGKAPPRDRRQLWHAHPDWFWHDAQGRRQPFGWYASLNPCYPEVRQYLVAVMHEIVAGYPVDGLHLDYIRYPNEWNTSYPRGAKVPDYPRDPRTLALFRQATGRLPDDAPAMWDAWRTEQLNILLRQIRAMSRQVRPRLLLSAAVKADPDQGRRAHFQDTRRWVAEGLLDAVMPMNYASDMELFTRRMQLWLPMRGRVQVVMGINADGRSPELLAAQLDAARRSTGGSAVFAYNALWERRDERGRDLADSDSPARRARCGAVGQALHGRGR